MTMNRHDLTIKQSNFCQHYILTGNASDAYREAYNSERMKTSTVHRKAAELMENGKVTACIRILQNQVQENFEVTLDTQIQRYNQLLNYAQKDIEDPRHRVDAIVKILARLDKISGLEHQSQGEGDKKYLVVLSEKDMLT